MTHETSELLQLLQKMVSFPSTDGNESGISDFLAQNATAMGMDIVEQQEALPGLKNVIAVKTFGRGGKRVILNSHMDVVPAADGWDTDPYELVQKGTRAYGRGSTDAKGPLACLTMAVKRIIENPEGVNGTIVYTAVVDEESRSSGARALVQHPQVYGDYCIVGEPTMSHVAVGHNGSLRPVIAIEGLSVHASNPELGINAIRIAAYISELVDEIAEEISGIVHPTTGKPSIAITMISGGVQENVIPDHCEVVIDRRMVPGESEEELRARFDRLCEMAQAKFPGSRVYVDHYLVTTGPAAETSVDSELVKAAYFAAESVTGEKQELLGLTCNTDMNHFTRAGIPTVIIGPGTITVAHKPNEYVEISQLEAACAVDEAVIRALLK